MTLTKIFQEAIDIFGIALLVAVLKTQNVLRYPFCAFPFIILKYSGTMYTKVIDLILFQDKIQILLFHLKV